MIAYSTLNGLKEGQIAKVLDIAAKGSMKRRLQDLGVIQGTNIECLQRNAKGDLTAFFIRGAAIALRAEDSCNISVAIA